MWNERFGARLLAAGRGRQLRWVLAVRKRIFSVSLVCIFATAMLGLVGGADDAFAQTPISIVVTSSLNPSVFGQTVTFTATVTGASPTGTVQFMDDGSNLGSAVTLVGGVASFTTSSLELGPLFITAVYGGDTNNLSSTSSQLIQTVNQVPTTTVVTSSLNPSTVGQSVTFTATVSGASPTGQVTFKDGATVLGVIPLSGGIATFSTASLPAGSHSITAIYGADDFNLFSSGSLAQTVKGCQRLPS
jgi:hypothetical protein